MAYGAILGQRFQPYSPEPPVPSGTTLSELSEGEIIKIKESGSPVEFYIAKHDYESDLNGAGRTLAVRKDVYDQRQWHSSNVNAYASSTIDSWLNSTYKNLLDVDIHSLINTTKIRYTPGNGDWIMSTLERSVFLLSLMELGESDIYANTEGSVLPIASTLKIVYQNGSPIYQWTRSPRTNGTISAWRLHSDGNITGNYCASTEWARPAFTLPSTARVDSNNNLIEQ